MAAMAAITAVPIAFPGQRYCPYRDLLDVTNELGLGKLIQTTIGSINAYPVATLYFLSACPMVGLERWFVVR